MSALQWILAIAVVIFLVAWIIFNFTGAWYRADVRYYLLREDPTAAKSALLRAETAQDREHWAFLTAFVMLVLLWVLR